MGAVLHGITDCPKCGSQNSRVVLTKPVKNGRFALVRRRRCVDCGERWYTAQAPEVYISGVDWSKQKGQCIAKAVFTPSR